MKTSGHTVMSPIDRDVPKPEVRRIPGIKTKFFCFLTVGIGNRIACRRLSCFCDPCVEAGPDVYLLGSRCENYETCGPWELHFINENDDEWSQLIDLLRKEGYNETGEHNDYCGCYVERFDPDTQSMKTQSDELTFGCGLGGHLLKCSFCFNTSHLNCCGFGEDRVKAPRNDWACPACINHAQLVLLPSAIESGTAVDYSVNVRL